MSMCASKVLITFLFTCDRSIQVNMIITDEYKEGIITVNTQ